jgi:hypothetical protein
VLTLKKAVDIIDFTIKRKLEIREGFIDPTKSWNRGDPNISVVSTELGRILSEDVEILKLIRSQMIPKCKHPKKMRDYDGNGWYCMNCNWDL